MRLGQAKQKEKSYNLRGRVAIAAAPPCNHPQFTAMPAELLKVAYQPLVVAVTVSGGCSLEGTGWVKNTKAPRSDEKSKH